MKERGLEGFKGVSTTSNPSFLISQIWEIWRESRVNKLLTKWILQFTLSKLTKLQTDYSLFVSWENFKVNEKKKGPEIHCFCLLWLKLHCFRFVLLCKRCLDSKILVGFGRRTLHHCRWRWLRWESEETPINLHSRSKYPTCTKSLFPHSRSRGYHSLWWLHHQLSPLAVEAFQENRVF